MKNQKVISKVIMRDILLVNKLERILVIPMGLMKVLSKAKVKDMRVAFNQDKIV